MQTNVLSWCLIFQFSHESVDRFQRVILGPAHAGNSGSVIWKKERILAQELKEYKIQKTNVVCTGTCLHKFEILVKYDSIFFFLSK